MGFNIDEEFNQALNLNSGSELKFVVTNGRSNLGFVKDLVFSEEIERIQRVAGEDIKEGNEKLKQMGDKILYLNGEYNTIKTVDPAQLMDLEKRLEVTEQNINATIAIQNGAVKIMKGIEDRDKQFIKLYKANIELIQTSIVKLKELDLKVKVAGVEELDIDRISKRKIEATKLQEQLVKSIKQEVTPTAILKNKRDITELQVNIIEKLYQQSSPQPIKSHKEGIIQLQKRLVKSIQQGATPTTVADIKKEITQVKIEIIEKLYQQSLPQPIKGYKKEILTQLINITKDLYNTNSYQALSIKNLKSKLVKSDMIIMEQTVGIFDNFITGTPDYTQIFLSEFRENLERVGIVKANLDAENENIMQLNSKLTDEIYKEGRCVLCNSKR